MFSFHFCNATNRVTENHDEFTDWPLELGTRHVVEEKIMPCLKFCASTNVVCRLLIENLYNWSFEVWEEIKLMNSFLPTSFCRYPSHTNLSCFRFLAAGPLTQGRGYWWSDHQGPSLSARQWGGGFQMLLSWWAGGHVSTRAQKSCVRICLAAYLALRIQEFGLYSGRGWWWNL